MRITGTSNLVRVCKRPRPKHFRVNARDRRQGPEVVCGLDVHIALVMDEASLASLGSWEDDDCNDCGNDPDIGNFDLRMFRDGAFYPAYYATLVTQPAHLWRPNQLQQDHVLPPLPPSSPLPPPILHEDSAVSSLTFGPSLPLPLSPAFLSMPGSGVALLKEDALVYQHHQSLERNPRTMKQDQSQLKSFFSFFQTASAKGCFIDQLPVPPAIMEVVKAFVAGPLDSHEEMCARMYSWCSPPFVENLVVMFSLFSTREWSDKSLVLAM
ncbi:hypothetical protein HaLaN_03384 [Haematococcus lacustris]|uniref:Uncharacterized protein n=1 Tax=Haematococcus lacustris TaxID=44745 RepID=A0A699YNE3_HAELA|nr:hypothetical protein HaLaN_03384 [Haematococcus lacustris]